MQLWHMHKNVILHSTHLVHLSDSDWLYNRCVLEKYRSYHLLLHLAFWANISCLKLWAKHIPRIWNKTIILMYQVWGKKMIHACSLRYPPCNIAKYIQSSMCILAKKRTTTCTHQISYLPSSINLLHELGYVILTAACNEQHKFDCCTDKF